MLHDMRRVQWRYPNGALLEDAVALLSRPAFSASRPWSRTIRVLPTKHVEPRARLDRLDGLADDVLEVRDFLVARARLSENVSRVGEASASVGVQGSNAFLV